MPNQANRPALCLLAATLLVTNLVATDSATSQTKDNFGGQARLDSWVVHQKMANESRFADLKWHAMGPKFVGGRVESIACPAGDLSTIYAGVGAGGVWRSRDGGLTWEAIFADQSTYSIGDIELDPKDPDVIWVGTGECHLSRSSYPGNGLYQSIDGGKTWQHRGLTESAHIGSVVVDPNDSNVIYVAALGRIKGGGQRGIFKSSNGGESFEKILEDGPDVSFVDLIVDATDSNRIYASAWDRSDGHGSGVYRSEDAGKTWKKQADGLPDKNVDRIAIALAPSKPNVLYALVTDRSSGALARRENAATLYRSTNYGWTWHATSQELVPTYIGWDFCDLRVAPDNHNQVYVGGLRMIASSDGGSTFVGEGGFAINRDMDQVFRIHAHPGIGMHLDVHDIWIDPQHPERILLGNDGGLFQSVDGGNTWLHLNSLPIAEFYRIHLDDEQPFQIWGGTQDNASLVGPETARYVAGAEDDWKLVFLDPWSGGDGFATFPDPHDPEITFFTQQNGDLKRSRRDQIRGSKSIRPRNFLLRPKLQFAWDTPFFASVHTKNQTRLYCAAQRVMKSDDRGDSWIPISPDFGDRPMWALSESPIDANRLGCGDGQGAVHLTQDGGEQWTTAASLPTKKIRDLQLSHHDPNVVYAALTGKEQSDCSVYLFRSADFGKTWKSIAGNLPAESVNAIEEDPKIPGLLYAGTDLGVYVSLDDGQTWHSLSRKMPTAPVADLESHPRDDRLVAATHGLGLFILDIKKIREAAR